jgi:hypothetical protein
MGHVDVHLAFYRQHPMAIELGRISRMLHLVSGNSMDEVLNRSYQASIETAGDITGEPVLSATGTEEGKYRVVQGNPSKAPKSKAELSGEPVLSAAGTEEGEYRVVQGNPCKAPRQSRAFR